MIKKILIISLLICFVSFANAMNYLMLPGEWGTLNDMQDSFYTIINPNVSLIGFRAGKTKQIIANYFVSASFLESWKNIQPFDLSVTMFDYSHHIGYAFSHYMKRYYLNQNSYFDSQVFSLSMGKTVNAFGLSGRLDYFKNKTINAFQKSSSARFSLGFIGFSDKVIYSLFYTSSMQLNFDNPSYLEVANLPSFWAFDFSYSPVSYLSFNQSLCYILPTYSTAFSTERIKVYDQELRWKLSMILKEKLLRKSKVININRIHIGFANISNTDIFSFADTQKDSIFVGGGFDIIVLPLHTSMSFWAGTTRIFDNSNYSTLSLKMEISL